MNRKNKSDYESPDVFIEKFICESGFAVSSDFEDGWDDGWDDTYSPTGYEAFFYGNLDEY